MIWYFWMKLVGLLDTNYNSFKTISYYPCFFAVHACENVSIFLGCCWQLPSARSLSSTSLSKARLSFVLQLGDSQQVAPPPGPPTYPPTLPPTHLSDYVKCVPVCVWELLLCSPIWSLFETTYIAHCDRPRRPRWRPHPSRSFAEHFAIFICIFAVPLSTVWRKSIVVCNKRKTNQALPTSFCSGAKIRFSVYVNTRTEL